MTLLIGVYGACGVLMVLGTGALEETYDLGLDAYRRGDFAASAAAFGQLAEGGVGHEAVHFNLGNALYREGRLGAAIASFERALAVNPGMADARANLAYCVGETERGLPRPLPPAWEQGLFFWHGGLHPRTVSVLAVVFWVVCWGSLALRQIRPLPFLRRSASKTFAWSAAVAAVLAAIFAASAWVKAHPAPLAVARAGPFPVRYGAGAEEPVRFELYEGDRVRVDGRSEDWVRVVTAGGERGWIRDDLVEFVGVRFRTGALPRNGGAEKDTRH